jgi:hypothetical protein
MWLRDYLPKDIQNRARVLIYGYESQLQGASVAKSIISDYGNSFIQNLMDIRHHPSVCWPTFSTRNPMQAANAF